MLRLKLLSKFNRCKICRDIMDHPSAFNYVCDEQGNIGIAHTHCWDQLPYRKVSAGKMKDMLKAQEIKVKQHKPEPVYIKKQEVKTESVPTKDEEIKPTQKTTTNDVSKSIEKKSNNKKIMNEVKKDERN